LDELLDLHLVLVEELDELVDTLHIHYELTEIGQNNPLV
jgi:hypothetical protein